MSVSGTRSPTKPSPSKAADDSDDEAAVQRQASDKLKLKLQSSSREGTFTVAARKKSTMMALIQYYLKKIGAELSEAEIKKLTGGKTVMIARQPNSKVKLPGL